MYINKDGEVIFQDMRDQLKLALKGLNYEQTLEFWEQAEKEFAKKKMLGDFYRCMAQVDRYFLLINMMQANYALHPWVFARCREVEADPHDHLDLWAREHFKSTVITVAGTIQEILKDPEVTVGIFSHTRGIAKKFLTQIRQEFEMRPVFHQVFPDIIWKNPKKEAPFWNQEKITVKRKSNAKEQTVEAWGVVDGQPTGAHFGLRVYDDLVTAESVSTVEQIQKTTDMLGLSNNLGKDGGKQWFIGTRYSHGDTYQSMIDKKQVKVRLYPATDDGTIGGNPVLFSREYWGEKVKNQPISIISCQMLQNPSAGSQSMFDKSTFKPYLYRPSISNIYIMVDPASSKKKGSDATAMAVIAVTDNMHKWLVDGYNHKMGLSEKWERLRDLHRKWSVANGVQMVKVGYEKYGMQTDIEHMKIQMRDSGYSFEIHELNWTRDGQNSKIDRMSRLEPDFRNSKFHLPAIIHDGGKKHIWGFIKDEKTNKVEWHQQPFSAQMEKSVMEKTRPGMIMCNPIVKIDEEGRLYDLTDSFIRQAATVPFAAGHDDLVDAASRIYDMEPVPPMVIRNGLLLPDASWFN